MVALGLVAIGLGYIGLAKYFAQAGERRSLLDVAYFILCLFVVESGEVSGALPWELSVARVLAPLVPAWAILRAAAILFREQLQTLRLLLTTQHVVICGLGRKGLQLAREFRARGDRVVVIEEDADDDAVRTCRELGVTTLVASATDSTTLSKARVPYAHRVFAVCGDDGTNVEIAVRVYDAVRARPDRASPSVQCYVQVVDLELCELFRQQRIFTETGDPLEVRIFNTFENSARLLWQSHPLDRVPIPRNDPRPVHLIVIGFGQMGEGVVLQAARTAHFANVAKPRITVVDELVDDRRKRFSARYPQFDYVCESAFLAGRAEDADVVTEVCRLAGQPGTIPTIAVCLDGDARGLSTALSLLAKLRSNATPVMVRMAEASGLATLLDATDGRASPLAGRLHAFGMTSQSCSSDLLLNEGLDRVARTIHNLQVQRYRDEGKAEGNPSAAPWEQLSETLKDSNRHQADHIPVKLRAIGCYSSTAPAITDPAVDAFSPAEIELLARMEHARWNAERWLDGWTLGPRDPAAKSSPYLVGWDELTEEIKDYDRAAVRNIPALLSLIGVRIHRASPPHQATL
jgi:predicted dinucleotide-binding enzyme